MQNRKRKVSRNMRVRISINISGIISKIAKGLVPFSVITFFTKILVEVMCSISNIFRTVGQSKNIKKVKSKVYLTYYAAL